VLAERWAGYDSRWFGDKLLKSPSKMTVAAYVMNFIVIYVFLETIIFVVYLRRQKTLHAIAEKNDRVVV
jgi:hypothetical protein